MKGINYFPIKILLGFLIFTEILFFAGPINYKINNTFVLILFFIIVNLALYIGYTKGVSTNKITKCNLSKRTIYLLLFAGLVLNIQNTSTMLATHNLQLSLDTIIFALTNPGDAYHVEEVKGIEGSLIWAILSPIRWASIPIGIFYWSKLNRFWKSIILFTIFIVIISWLGIGTRKGLLDIILVTAFSGFAKYHRIITRPKNRMIFIILIISSITLFLFYFVYSNMSRYTFTDISDLSEVYMNKHDYKTIYLENVNPIFLATMGQITDYLCQGYFALSKGIEIGIITPTLFSMSWFSIFIGQKLGIDPTNSTYMVMLEQFGIDRYINWHSIYLWLANEFTFLLVPFIIYIIGLYFGRIWKDCIAGNNPWSYSLMTLFVIMIFYFFANNQIFSGSYICFCGSFLIYKITSKRI